MKIGDTYVNPAGTRYRIDNLSGFCGHPTGTIMDEPNKGIRVILVGAATPVVARVG